MPLRRNNDRGRGLVRAFQQGENLPACLNGTRNATLWFMRTIPGWDQYYLEICKVVAARSKDPNTQIGCVIVGPNHEIRSTGYNSFPRGIRDDVPERLVRPTKYLWIEHAERNAICNAARAGTATEGCTIYVEIMPCMDCGRADRAGGDRAGGGLGGANAAVLQPILRRALRHDGDAVRGSRGEGAPGVTAQARRSAAGSAASSGPISGRSSSRP